MNFSLLEACTCSLVWLPIFLLAFQRAISHYVAVLADDGSWLLADQAYLEIWKDFVFRHFFVWDDALLVLRVGVGSQLHQEDGDVFGASYSCKVEWGVSILISDIWIGTVFEKQLKNLRARIVSRSLEQRRSVLRINVVDIAFGDDQSLTYVIILLHTSQSQSIFSSAVDFPRRCTKLQKQLNNRKVSIHSRFHEASGLQVISLVDVEFVLELLSLLHGF